MELRDKNGLTEKEYMAQYKRGSWPLPSVTADQVLLSKEEDGYDILLIRRGGHPCLNQWALPGGFLNEQEPPLHAAARELLEETGLEGISSVLLGVFGDPGRDIRGWTITCAYCSLVDRTKIKPQAGDDAKDAQWFHLSWKKEDHQWKIQLEREDTVLSAVLTSTLHRNALGTDISFEILENQGLAFDHAKIIATAIHRMENSYDTFS
ncbi:MAG: NUDIX hydrolase [Clostridiales bacterium]|nr:NUDIX hydrolase [Clostridiales bacterium]